MSGEVLAATAVGVGTATAVFVFDQNLAMASAAGVSFYLAASITIPLQVRFFFGVGSFLLGYIVGLAFMKLTSGESWQNWAPAGPVLALAVSALGSTIFGSLNKWADGGDTPAWIEFLARISPFRWKKDGDSNE